MRILYILLLAIVVGVGTIHEISTDNSNSFLSYFVINTVYGQSDTSTQTQYVSYTNSKYGFNLEYPASWTYKENPSYTIENSEIVNFMASPETQISISRHSNNEFKNLSDQLFLDKMIKKYNDECNSSKSTNGCLDFQLLMSTIDSSGKYPIYTIGYTYSEKSFSDDIISKSKLVVDMPASDSLWTIIIFSSSNDLPNHLEEIASFLNSFTILPESKDSTATTSPPVSTTTNLDSTKKGGGCLIATATYGSELAPQVQLLRELRDNQLLKTTSGTSFMTGFNQFYYSFSPTIADWERENPAFKEFVKITLTPMISSLSILNYVNMDSESSVLGYGISLILLNVGMYFVGPGIVIYKIRKTKTSFG